MAKHVELSARLRAFTETVLTARKKRHLRQKLKQQSRHWLVDWADAILWAILMVLLFNQYLFQMYRIPSPSMTHTLEVGDMIFVNKMVYGPELLPGLGKLPGLRKPERGEVVVFENPEYLGKGPVFTVLKQFVYMASLTMVDIDKDELGNPRVQYLIKRAVGAPGDVLNFREGELSFRFRGEDRQTAERDYLAKLGATRQGRAYTIYRNNDPDDYPPMLAQARKRAISDMGLPAASESQPVSSYDDAAYNGAYYAELAAANPQDARLVAMDRKYRSGWYVPEGRIFTLGDNRDNSKDARWYGAVSMKRVLGHALFVYWPLGRVGGIR